jgi:hypothetical protein
MVRFLNVCTIGDVELTVFVAEVADLLNFIAKPLCGSFQGIDHRERRAAVWGGFGVETNVRLISWDRPERKEGGSV